MYNCTGRHMRRLIDRQPFELYESGVSEAVPLRVLRATHRRCGPVHYDMHFGLEMGIVLSGAMRRDYQVHRRSVRRGQVWLCGLWEPHGFSVIEAPCEVVVVLIWPPMLANLRFEEAPEIDWMAPFSVRPADRPRVRSAMRNRLLERAGQLKALSLPSPCSLLGCHPDQARCYESSWLCSLRVSFRTVPAPLPLGKLSWNPSLFPEPALS